MEEIMLIVGEQVLNKKPGFEDFKDFTIFKKEERVVGTLTNWGITYKGATIGFAVFDDEHVSFVPGDHLDETNILLN